MSTGADDQIEITTVLWAAPEGPVTELHKPTVAYLPLVTQLNYVCS